MPRTGLPLPWLFGAPARQLVGPAALRILDDPLGVVAAARSGAGLCQSYHFLVEREVERGELVEVLAERGGRTRPFSLIYPRVPGGAAAHPRAVRAVIAFILEVATARAADPTAAGLTRRGPARRS
jgi:DNA-binding transcriptional LysR family regulator